MPKEHKPGWLYFKSGILNKEFAFHEKTGWVYFEDGVRYSPKEIKILYTTGGITDSLHNAKLVFKESDVVNESKTETNNKRKSDERGGEENKTDNSASDKSVQKNTYEIPEPRPGELIIY
jgi:hypothetical protein